MAVAKKKAAKKATKKKAGTRARPAAAPVRKKAATKKKAGKQLAVKKETPIADIKAALKQEADEIGKQIGGAAGPKIVITRAKMFRMPDGRESPQIGVVVLAFRTHHLFYDKPWREGEVSPPVCYAIGENPRQMTASSNAPELQEEDGNCQICPMNEFGSAGNGKACQNRRMLAVLPPGADDEEDILTLSVSPTALKRWDAYVSQVKAEWDMPPIAVVTQVSFDPHADYATLVFGDPVPNPDLQSMFARRDEAVGILEMEPQ